MPTCPMCAENIPAKARVCPHCDSDLEALKTGRDSGSAPQRKSSSSTLIIVLGVLFVGGVMVVGVLVALLLPAVQQAREAARQSQCRNNMKQIALALHSYADEHGSFPPAYTVDEQGRPLHSWRVLILPYLDEQNLFHQIDLTQPWDSPANSMLHSRMPPTFGCPSRTDAPLGLTHYLGLAGPNCALRTDGTGTGFRDMTDGMSNVVIAVEAETPVRWMEPKDIDFATLATTQPLGLVHQGHTHANVLMADGAVRSLGALPPAKWQALATINGDEQNPLDDF